MDEPYKNREIDHIVKDIKEDIKDLKEDLGEKIVALTVKVETTNGKVKLHTKVLLVFGAFLAGIVLQRPELIKYLAQLL